MSKETNVERAKLAEQAERYDDMAQVSLTLSKMILHGPEETTLRSPRAISVN